MWNLRADARPLAWARLFVGVNNLLDSEYRERRQGSMGGIFPGVTRTVYGGLEVTFG